MIPGIVGIVEARDLDLCRTVNGKGHRGPVAEPVELVGHDYVGIIDNLRRQFGL